MESTFNKTKNYSVENCKSQTSDEEFVDADHLPFDNINLSESIWDNSNDNDDSNDELNMEGNSIISHLLSQVKIGMDLTKVTLPTFILEKRSCLEMFADFLSHPDIFVSIAKFQTPYLRIEAVLKWYLSCLHAGRKSSVPKKPYNPILGEVFQCFYSLDSSKDMENVDFNVKSVYGPVPWASSKDVTFIAEQVSHHPPISAFYAESIDHKICLNGSIWTKSQFLGLSVAVHMVGKAVLSLNDLNEHYTLTFPDGYGRSILTVPWFEMGGKCEIICEKTHYRAKIEFLTKPFYGGKKDCINAEIFSPDSKKPIKSIIGQWNGIMSDSSDKSDFIDTKALPIYKKYVRSLKHQQSYESRKLWHDVTTCLKRKNMNGATKFKSQIEERQRSEAKYRNEHGLAWSPKFFKQQQDSVWTFNNNLFTRFSSDNSKNE